MLPAGVTGVVRNRILVVDDSAAVRETVRTVLSGEYEVRTLPRADYLADPGRWQAEADLLILAAEPGAAGSPAVLPTIYLADAPGPAADLRCRVLPHRFSPRDLCHHVSALLAQAPGDNPQASLDKRMSAPYVPAAAAHVLRCALDNRLPVFIQGEAGTGKRTLARALHQAGGGGEFLSCSALAFASDARLAPGVAEVCAGLPGTLYLNGIDRLPDAGQDRLEDLLDPVRNVVITGRSALRVVAAAEGNLGRLVDEGRFARDLYYRITVLPVQLLALRERAADIPALAEAIADDLCARLGLPPVTFTDRSLDRLSNYLWDGNLAELESVLARTLAIHRPALVDADHLLFESVAILPPPRAKTPPPAEERRGVSGPTLELIANEIAHELWIPMVTVKTFAQITAQLVRGDADHEEIARLAGEAIDRMDGVLENLLRFARFRTPARRPVPLASLVAGPVDELAHLIHTSGGQLDRDAAPTAVVLADTDQIDCALSNLFAALARGGAPGAHYSLAYQQPSTMLLRLPPDHQRRDGRLAELVNTADGAEPPLPLGIAIARSLIESNGGEMILDQTTEQPTVTVRFVAAEFAEEDNSGDGKAPRPDRG